MPSSTRAGARACHRARCSSGRPAAEDLKTIWGELLVTRLISPSAVRLHVMSESKLIHLAADLSHYHTDYLCKMPGSWEGYPYYSSPEFYEDIARTAARGIMDMLFFGDSGGTP